MSIQELNKLTEKEFTSTYKNAPIGVLVEVDKVLETALQNGANESDIGKYEIFRGWLTTFVFLNQTMNTSRFIPFIDPENDSFTPRFIQFGGVINTPLEIMTTNPSVDTKFFNEFISTDHNFNVLKSMGYDIYFEINNRNLFLTDIQKIHQLWVDQELIIYRKVNYDNAHPTYVGTDKAYKIISKLPMFRAAIKVYNYNK